MSKLGYNCAPNRRTPSQRFRCHPEISVAVSVLLCLAIFAIGLMRRSTTSAASITWVPANGEPATLVLGQTNFTSKNGATTQSGIREPFGIAVDPVTNKVFVADSFNNRVLRFASLATLQNGSAAETVLGQADFTSHIAAVTQSGMYNPFDLAIDIHGTLWVADTGNNRILRFDAAASKANGANADGVLGQTDFTSNTWAITQSRMFWPVGVTVDTQGTLWVVDTDNIRILRFDTAAGKANGANADGVLGQANFTSNTNATSQSGMYYPYKAAIDTHGTLWVADYGNHRVLRFDAAASKANGADADGVLGQSNFTSRLTAVTQSGMFGPSGLAVDSNGTLWVADGNNSRILRFAAAAGKSNGANADGVLGQPDFTSHNETTSQTGMDIPEGLAVDANGTLWVADDLNSRVLHFGPVSVPTTPTETATATATATNTPTETATATATATSTMTATPPKPKYRTYVPLVVEQ